MFEKEIDLYNSAIVKDLVELLNIDTRVQRKKPNKPFGEGAYAGLMMMLDKGRKFGFNVQNYCGYCGHIQAGSGSYTVGVICNLDILNMKAVKIKNDLIFGEGALKGKGALISVFYAMKILSDKKLIPKDKKIRLLVLCDKLSGTKGLDYYREFEQPHEIGFAPDGMFPVIYGEKGSVFLKLSMNVPSRYDAPINIVEITGGGDCTKVPDKANIILNCEEIFRNKIEDELKAYTEKNGLKYNVVSQNKLMCIEMLGKTAKGSEPEKGINAISHSMKFLSCLSEFMDRREFIDEYDKLISTTYNGERLGCNFEDSDSGRFTFNIGKINLINDYVEIEADARFPISVMYTDVFEKLSDAFKYSPLKIEDIRHIRPVSFLKDSFVVRKLNKVYSDVFNDDALEPYVTEGTSYAREMSNTVCFGPESSSFNLQGMEDEFISVDYLKKLTEVYAQALYELLN